MRYSLHHGKHAKSKQSMLRRLSLIPVTGAMALTPIIVQPGDTLSGIAQENGKSLNSVIAANPQIENPNLIFAGEKVNIPGGGDHSSGSGGGAPAAPHKHHTPQSDTSPFAGSMSQSAKSSGGSNSSSDLADVPGVPRDFAKCVAFRESSNNPQSVNSVPGFEGMGGGAYGIMDYVWQGSDLNKSGQPYDAPLSEQKAAFSHLYSLYGNQPWTPSDGCL